VRADIENSPSSVEFVSQMGVLSRLSVQGEWQPVQSRNSNEFRRFATDARKEQTHVTMVFASADYCLRANLEL
jgi:hypothetical protein